MTKQKGTTQTRLSGLKYALNKFTGYILLILIVIIAVSLAKNILGINQGDQRINEVEERAVELKKEKEVLEKKLVEMESDDYIEKQLRDKLGMAKEGEIVIVLPDPQIVRKFAPKVEQEEEILPDPIWKKWAKLFGFSS